jgi:hypothetical protein
MSTGNRLVEEYVVALICALPLGLAAAKSMLDETHHRLSQPVNDENTYTLGKMCRHNLVVTRLPIGVYGTTAAAAVVSQMWPTYSRISVSV